MGRPKSDDRKVTVSLSLRRSTVARIRRQFRTGKTVNSTLAAEVENEYGKAAGGG